jgi:hypothetical protein
MDQENVVFMHNEILLNHKEEWNFVISSKWMELENIVLSKVSQVQKAKSHIFPHMWIIDPKQFSNIIGQGSHTKGRTTLAK